MFSSSHGVLARETNSYRAALSVMHHLSSKLKLCIENIKEELETPEDKTIRLLLLESLLVAKRTFLEFIVGEYVNEEKLRCKLCGRVFKRRGISNHLTRAHHEIWKSIRPYDDIALQHLRNKNETSLSSEEWERQLLARYEKISRKHN